MSSSSGLSLFGPHQQRHGVFFGLVDLDLGLVAFDQALAQIVGALGFFRDLAQRHDGVLVVVAVHGDRGTGGNFARTVGGKHHQFEPVRNLVNAIFNGHAGHGTLQISRERIRSGLFRRV